MHLRGAKYKGANWGESLTFAHLAVVKAAVFEALTGWVTLTGEIIVCPITTPALTWVQGFWESTESIGNLTTLQYHKNKLKHGSGGQHCLCRAEKCLTAVSLVEQGHPKYKKHNNLHLLQPGKKVIWPLSWSPLYTSQFPLFPLTNPNTAVTLTHPMSQDDGFFFLAMPLSLTRLPQITF